MSDSLADKVVVVTGASMGIGRAVVQLLAGRGARVVAAARSADKLRALAAESPSVVAVPTDVADEASVRRLADAARARCGRIDAVVNNAAIGHLAPFLESTPAEWREIIDINVIGSLHVMHAFLPMLLEAGSGVVINVGSTGEIGWPYLTMYSATKAALRAATTGLDREHSGRGVRIVTVEIGPTQGTGFGARFTNRAHLAEAARAWTDLGIDWNKPVAPADSAARIVATIDEHVGRR